MPRLSHSPADIIRQHLIDAGLGTDPDSYQTGQTRNWPVFAAGEPDTPDNVITVYDTTAIIDARIMVTGEITEHEGYQVRVRGVTHQIGNAKADAIRVYMSETAYNAIVTIEGKRYRIPSFVQFGNLNVLGPDTPNTKRKLFTFNGTCVIQPLN